MSFITRLRRLVGTGQSPGQGDLDEREGRWRAIAASVGLAFLIWFMVSMGDTYQEVFELPTQVVNIPPGQAIHTPVPRTVRIQVEGEGWQLIQLVTNPQPIQLDAASRTIDIYEAAGNILSGLTIQPNVSPPEIEIVLEEEVTRKVPVQIWAQISTEAPYDFAEDYRVVPDSVEITGAVSIVNEIDSWPTEYFEREGVIQSFNTQIALSDSLSDLIRLNTSSVQLQVQVVPYTENERDLLVKVEDLPPGEGRVKLIPERIHVTYRVPASSDQFDISQTTDAFYASVPYAVIVNDTTGWIMPEINIPPDLKIKDIRAVPARLRYYTILD